MTNSVRFAFGVGDNYLGGLQLGMQKTNQIGSTEYKNLV